MTEPAPHARRADFQGLRALAVCIVIAYHFGVPGFSGGFVGVDVFFVLSGFFITRLLMRDMATHGRVRLTAFWLARAKRLLPNSALVLLATLAATALVLPPYRFPAIATDIGAAAIFLANWHFASAAINYFNIGTPPSPVLHFWSLAVEEQFYLALPIVLTLTARFGTWRFAIPLVLATLALASFLASIWIIADNHPAAFFLPQYRAWELLIGGLVGLSYDHRHRIPATLRALAAWAGLALILWTTTALTDATIYPGLWALAPTLATAALLLGLRSGNATTPLGRVLASPPAVLIGDMSYSLYLWHWPVAIVIAARWPDQPSITTLGLLITAILAALAYYGVERPIHRLAPTRFKPQAVFATAIASICLVLLATLTLANLPSPRDPAITAAIATAQADVGAISTNGCFLNYDDIAQPLCRDGDLTSQRRVVLFGDSHATQWYLPLAIAAKNAGWLMELRNKSSCPFADVTVYYVPLKARYIPCDTWRTEQVADLLANPPALVVLASSSHYDTRLLDRTTGQRAASNRDLDLWQTGIKRTTTTLQQAGIAIIEVRDTPQLYANLLDCLSVGDWTACTRPRAEALAGLPSPTPDWPVFDFTDVLCTPASCPATHDGALVYRDREHLTYSFPAIVAPRFEAALRDLD